MTEEQEIQQRYAEIAEMDRRLEEAKKALDIQGWARENDIDLDLAMQAVRRRCSPAELAEAQRTAEEQANALNHGLAQSTSAFQSTAQTPSAPRRGLRSMV